VSVFGAVGVSVSFEVGVPVGYGFPRVCGRRVYGQVQWPIDTSQPVVYVVSGRCPSGTWLASVSARSLPSEWLCALILPRCVRM
jgi:hypothetical protein